MSDYTGNTLTGKSVKSIVIPKKQRGVAAIEFALVFPIFFVLLYGIITYSLIFVAQQALTLAAEEGARAALRYAATPAARGSNACIVAKQSVSWLGTGNVACTTAITPPCSSASAAPCSPAGSTYPIKVTVSYPYAAQPLVPLLLGSLMNVAVPSTLGSSATVQID
ncbi:TadE/TadG family type IV pilus assembly protein [Glaciimonas immobilis]|nr:pilus assembly protein [Glaciimonas immobilis]